MYYNPYEDYMRNSLNYNTNPMMNMMQEPYESENTFTYEEMNVDDMYPEIYRMVYPMVCKACMNVQDNITEDLVSRLTNEIYTNLENEEAAQENRSIGNHSTAQTGKAIRVENTNAKVNTPTVNHARHEERNRNPFLRDLIRILVLRELVGRPRPAMPRPPYRPPYGGIGPGPNRPPMPGPGVRPEPRSPYAF